jgi:hypothetical protein
MKDNKYWYYKNNIKTYVEEVKPQRNEDVLHDFEMKEKEDKFNDSFDELKNDKFYNVFN